MNRVLTAVIAVATALLWSANVSDAKSSRYNADYFSNRPVITQNGEKLRFYDDLIKDKVVVISFIYTSCPQICPVNTSLLAEVQRRLGDAVGRDIFMISLTVDPQNDTPERLKAYAETFGAGPGWSFVTGEPEDVKAITRALGDRTENLDEHLNEVVLGNDRTGEWARNSTMGELESLVLEIRAMDPEWRNQAGVLDADPSFTREAPTGFIRGQPGQVLFKRLCSGCHTIGVGDRVGPDLMGVTERRDRDWLTRFISDPMAMRVQKDPVALALMEEFPNVRMPFLGLSGLDAADLISYLEAQSARITEARQPTGSEHHANESSAGPAADHGAEHHGN